MSITRKQLRGFGASEYLAKQLTHGLTPAGQQGRAHAYEIDQILNTIRKRLENPKIRNSTRIVLLQLEIEVGGLIEKPVSNQNLLDAIAEAAQANTRFEQTARHSRKVAQELQNYKSKRGSTFTAHNNVVAFKS